MGDPSTGRQERQIRAPEEIQGCSGKSSFHQVKVLRRRRVGLGPPKLPIFLLEFFHSLRLVTAHAGGDTVPDVDLP